jgi:hypothetical protein
MRKHIVCELYGRRIPIAWISLQPTGFISFGLQDRTYISPRFRAQHYVWSAFNRTKIEYYIRSDPSAFEAVTNPHFTFHPPGFFHLRANGDEPLFEGINLVDVSVHQDGSMPWLRAISAPIKQLRSSNRRSNGIQNEDLLVKIPSENSSIQVNLDFISRDTVGKFDHDSRWSFQWHDVALQVTVSFTYPQIATLWWFHSY